MHGQNHIKSIGLLTSVQQRREQGSDDAYVHKNS